MNVSVPRRFGRSAVNVPLKFGGVVPAIGVKVGDEITEIVVPGSSSLGHDDAGSEVEQSNTRELSIRRERSVNERARTSRNRDVASRIRPGRQRINRSDRERERSTDSNTCTCNLAELEDRRTIDKVRELDLSSRVAGLDYSIRAGDQANAADESDSAVKVPNHQERLPEPSRTASKPGSVTWRSRLRYRCREFRVIKRKRHLYCSAKYRVSKTTDIFANDPETRCKGTESALSSRTCKYVEREVCGMKGNACGVGGPGGFDVHAEPLISERERRTDRDVYRISSDLTNLDAARKRTVKEPDSRLVSCTTCDIQGNVCIAAVNVCSGDRVTRSVKTCDCQIRDDARKRS